MKDIKKFHVTLPIIRKKVNKPKTATFKGYLHFVCNKYGVIFDWKIEFTRITVDLMTTEAWFKSKSVESNFFRRETLFGKIGLKQIPRPTTQDHLLKELNPSQIEKVNEYFNNRDLYKSTIKNIIAVLKGSNKRGEAKKPNSAEMVIDSDGAIKNFTILLDHLIMDKGVLYNSAMIGAKELPFYEFVCLNKQIKAAFEYMQSPKTLGDWNTYLIGIEKYYKEFNEDCEMVEFLTSKARTKFTSNIEKIEKLPFNFKNKGDYKKDFIRCHIYEVKHLKAKILEAIRDNVDNEKRKEKEVESYLSMISDPDNFIPLPQELHNRFDSNLFTYRTNGLVKPLNEDGRFYVEQRMSERFKRIPDEFLTRRRKQYLEYRNQNTIV